MAVASIRSGFSPQRSTGGMSAEAYLNRGNAKYNLGRYEEALADYTEAIRLKPDYAVAYHNRGNAKDDLGRSEEALADYTEAIRLKPDYAEAYTNRGIAKDNLGRSEEALADYTEAIRLKPDYAGAYHNRGFAKDNLGRSEEALADYTEAIRLKPDYALAIRNKQLAEEALAKSRTTASALPAASAAGAGAPHGAGSGRGAPVEEPAVSIQELQLSVEECRLLIARLPSRDEFQSKADRREVAPAIELAVRAARKEAELKWLATNPDLLGYYRTFKNILCGTISGAMAIHAGMAGSSGASSFETKAQKGAKYFSKLFKFLPLIKDAATPLQTAIATSISISNANKVTYLLRCFPDFEEALMDAEELARGIAIAMREAIYKDLPATGYRFIRAIKEYATRTKRSAKNLFYVNDQDTPYKQRAYEEVHKIILFMTSGTILTKENCTVEHIVSNHLAPKEPLLTSPIEDSPVDTVTAAACVEGSSGGSASADVMTLQELLAAETKRREAMEKAHQAMEARLDAERAARERIEAGLKRLEAVRKTDRDLEARGGNQSQAFAAAEARGTVASHEQALAPIHTELGQLRTAVEVLAVRTGGGLGSLDAPASVANPLERAQLLGTAPIDAAAAEVRAISAKDHHTLGIRKYLRGRYEEAIEDFNAAITSNPNYALAYYNRGRAYLALKQNREALADFIQALALKPDFEQASRAKELVGGFRS